MTIQNIGQISLGVSRLTSFLQDSENVKKFLEVCLEEIEELSTALIVLAGQKDIESVEGVWLDFIGSVVGITREGLPDEQYKPKLLLKISVNTANGTHPSTSEILKNFTLSDNVKLLKGILSYGQVIVDGYSNVDLSLWELLQDIIPVTTSATIMQDTNKKCFFPSWEKTQESLTELFELHDGENLELSSDLGFITDLLSLTSENPDTESEISNTGRHLIGWQEPVTLELLTDTRDDLVLVDESGENLLILQGQYYEDGTEVLLPWEINEDCILSLPIP